MTPDDYKFMTILVMGSVGASLTIQIFIIGLLYQVFTKRIDDTNKKIDDLRTAITDLFKSEIKRLEDKIEPKIKV